VQGVRFSNLRIGIGILVDVACNAEAILVEYTKVIDGSRRARVGGPLEAGQSASIVRFELLAKEFATPDDGTPEDTLRNDGPGGSVSFKRSNGHDVVCQGALAARLRDSNRRPAPRKTTYQVTGTASRPAISVAKSQTGYAASPLAPESQAKGRMGASPTTQSTYRTLTEAVSPR
jgi:hypothetical protein